MLEESEQLTDLEDCIDVEDMLEKQMYAMKKYKIMTKVSLIVCWYNYEIINAKYPNWTQKWLKKYCKHVHAHSIGARPQHPNQPNISGQK